jgi:hypothetical protein
MRTVFGNASAHLSLSFGTSAAASFAMSAATK